MYSPRPYGLLTVGGELTQADSVFIEHLARRLTNLKELSDVDSLRMVRTLPDGGYVLAQDMGGTFRVITHKPEQKVNINPFDGIAKVYIPMLFSGVITNAKLKDEQGLGMKLSEQTRLRLNNYNPDNLPPKNVALQKFRVDYNDLVQEFKPQVITDIFHTQYVQQRPTWYSGAMAEVMQVVGGYGKQNISSLPDTPIERAKFNIPTDILKNIHAQMGDIRLPAYTGLPDINGQFQYDYKFNNTHGISFDSEQKPWLIRVDPSGVWVMPFPLIPATTTNAFRDYIVSVGDQEILKILDRFGGMPSGESFPKDDAFQAWQRAGVVIKVCDVGSIYQHNAYSSTCGWSFNLKGTEGFNTCYDYYDEDGLGYGLAYKLKLSLGPVINNGNLPPITAPDEADKAQIIGGYLSQLVALLPDSVPKYIAVKYKLRRATTAELYDRASVILKVDQTEVDYWDNLTMTAIASHTGNVAEVGRGYLYNGLKFKLQPQIKFPEPFSGGCVSHDFLPQAGHAISKFPNSNTVMFGYYIGDDLKVIKYFHDGRGFIQEIQSDYEECMIVGSWTQTQSIGSSTLNGNFFTSDIDQRESFAPTVTTTTIVGKDKGYDSKPFFAFDAPFWAIGTIWRNRYFTHKTNIHRTEGRILNIGICIPYFCRNALLHAARTSTTGSSKSESLHLYSLNDPTSYRYWTYDTVFAFLGGLPVMKGKPQPKDGNPVWVEMEEYNPSTCSDFADQGAWIPSLPADYTSLIHPNRNQWNLSGGGGAPKVQEYLNSQTGLATETGSVLVSIVDQTGEVHQRVPDPNYFLGSPDDAGFTFYQDGCKVVFGESIYANVSEIGSGGQRRNWGYSNLVDHKSPHHFIGVINE